MQRLRTPNRRFALLLLAVAATWTAWAVWPPRPLTRWAHPSPRVDSYELSPDGTHFLAIEFDSLSMNSGLKKEGSVRLWELASGRPLVEVEHAGGGGGAHTFAPDGSWLATEDHRGTITVWDTADGRSRLTLPPDDPAKERAYAVSSDGRLLACATPEGRPPSVRLWDVAEQRVRATFPGAADPVAFSPDGRTLVTGFAGGDFDAARLCYAEAAPRLWDTADGRERGRLDGPWSPQPAVAAFSPDGQRLAIGLTSWRATRILPDAATSLTLWDPAPCRLSATVHPVVPYMLGPAYDGRAVLRFSPDGRFLIVCLDCRGQFWDLLESPPRNLDRLLAGNEETGRRLDASLFPLFTPRGGRFLVPAASKGGLTVYDSGTLTPVVDLPLPNPLWTESGTRALSTNGRMLAWPDPIRSHPLGWLYELLKRPAPYNRGARLFDIERGEKVGHVPPGDSVLGFAPDGNSLWMLRHTENRNGSPGTLEVHQWAVPTGGTPAWPWAVTVLAVVLAVADRQRSRRRASLATAAASRYPARQGGPPPP